MDAADRLGIRHFPAEAREGFPAANEAVGQHYGGADGGGRKQREQNDAKHDRDPCGCEPIRLLTSCGFAVDTSAPHDSFRATGAMFPICSYMSSAICARHRDPCGESRVDSSVKPR